MASTLFKTFVEFEFGAREADRMASAAAVNVRDNVCRCRCLISESRELIAKVNEILDRDLSTIKPLELADDYR